MKSSGSGGTSRRYRGLAPFLSVLLSMQLVAQSQPVQKEAPPQQQEEKKETQVIRIVVMEGDGAINSIKQHSSKDVIVRVSDAEGHPVRGAMVTFHFPESGPSAQLPSGGALTTTPTDAQGLARLRGVQPNDVQGDFTIKVSASYSGQTANIEVAQTNVMSVETETTPSRGSVTPATKTASGSNKMLWILIIAGGAGGALAAAAGGHKGSSTGGSPTPTPSGTSVVITPGTPSVGGPH